MPASVMAVAGGIGVGLVIGWVAGQIVARSVRVRISMPSATVATLAAGAGVALLSTADALAGYGPAVVVAVGLSLVWQHWLEKEAMRSW